MCGRECHFITSIHIISVAAGLCPIALGADGGGSIRIPSAVCGIVGPKNTFGRISGTGYRVACDTVGVPGPLCATMQVSW